MLVLAQGLSKTKVVAADLSIVCDPEIAVSTVDES
jgi:hypothetical protein